MAQTYSPPREVKLTLGHDNPHTINCRVCVAARAEKLDPAKFGLLPFKLAAPHWLKEKHGTTDRKQAPVPKTFEQHEYYIRTLLPFFGDFPLNEIHIGQVESYVDMRLQTPRKITPKHAQGDLNLNPELNFNRLVGPSVVRHEISFLAQVMGPALWKPIKEHYKPPKLPKSTVGKALEPDEEKRLFTVASSNKRWKLAYWGSLITAQTTSDHGEIRHLHLNDINLAQMTMHIRDGLKNEHRDRIVEIVNLPDVIWAFKQILSRYYRICRRQHIQPDGDHYILPGRAAGVAGYDFTKPMGSWKRAWAALTEMAGLAGLRMKDLRHHALTKLLENPELSERTVVEIAGHVSKSQWKTYSHIRRRPKQEAMKTLHFSRPQAPPPVDLVETVDIDADVPPNFTETKSAKKG